MYYPYNTIKGEKIQMKICLKKISNMSACNEYNLIICADGGIGGK